jgi:hypothetical protein
MASYFPVPKSFYQVPVFKLISCLLLQAVEQFGVFIAVLPVGLGHDRRFPAACKREHKRQKGDGQNSSHDGILTLISGSIVGVEGRVEVFHAYPKF